MTANPIAKANSFVTLISLWLKAPADVQRRVLFEARQLAQAKSKVEGLSRRGMLAGIAAAPAVALPAISEEKELSPYDQVKRDAEALAVSMAALHAGAWGVHIDHDAKLVAVTRSFGAASSEMRANPVNRYRVISENGTVSDDWL